MKHCCGNLITRVSKEHYFEKDNFKLFGAKFICIIYKRLDFFENSLFFFVLIVVAVVGATDVFGWGFDVARTGFY